MLIKNIKAIKKLSGRKILLRTDFNVPLKNGRILDIYKIEQSLPTIRYLLAQQAQVIILSHLGRPNGVDPKFSLRAVARVLSKLLGQKVIFLALDQPTTMRRLAALKNGEVCLLENIRFTSAEQQGDWRAFRDLASVADLYVLDGFGVAHRDSPSVTGMAHFLPTYAGLLLMKEMNGLNKAIQATRRPLTVVLGGAKMETKIPILKHLARRADYILLGGGIVNTYLWATGHKVGVSLVDKKYRQEILSYCRRRSVVLPVDVVVGTSDGRNARVMSLKNKLKLSPVEAVLDIGPATIALFARYIKKARTLIWNGAMGYFEQHPFEYGTQAIARLFAARARGQAFGVCGGGETVELLRQLDLLDEIDLVSTGGGAMLDYLSGKKLPGIQILLR